MYTCNTAACPVSIQEYIPRIVHISTQLETRQSSSIQQSLATPFVPDIMLETPEILCDNSAICSGKSILGMDTEKIICDDVTMSSAPSLNDSCINTEFLISSNSFIFEAGRGSFINGKLMGKNVSEINCKEGGCIGSEFLLGCDDINGCVFECEGENTCQGIFAGLVSPKKVYCSNGENTCNGGRFFFENSINDVSEPFMVECKSKYACKDTNWDLGFNDNAFVNFEFDGFMSGDMVTINILNEGTLSNIDVSIMITCKDTLSCSNILVTAATNVTILDTENIFKCEKNDCQNVLVTTGSATTGATFNSKSKDIVNDQDTNEKSDKVVLISIIAGLSAIVIMLIMFMLLKMYVCKSRKNNEIEMVDIVDNVINQKPISSIHRNTSMQSETEIKYSNHTSI